MNFIEMIEYAMANDINQVTVLSYGYTEVSVLNRVFQPFSKKREFKFNLDICKEEPELSYLEHKWLFFSNENTEVFSIEDGNIICDDPDLCAHPDY